MLFGDNRSTAFVLLILYLALPLAWGQIEPEEISIVADKKQVVPGQTIVITGKVTGVEPGDKPLLRVFGPDGEPYRFDPVDVDTEGNYSYELVLGGIAVDAGEYRLVINYGAREAETTVTWVSHLPLTCQEYSVPHPVMPRFLLNAGNATYEIRYILLNATLTKIEEDFEKKSLLAQISSANDGCFIVLMPSEVIEAENRNFTVTVDDQAGTFREIEDDRNGMRTLYIEFKEGASKIEITGTRVLPEFPLPTLGLVFIITIIGITIARSMLWKTA